MKSGEDHFLEQNQMSRTHMLGFIRNRIHIEIL